MSRAERPERRSPRGHRKIATPSRRMDSGRFLASRSVARIRTLLSRPDDPCSVHRDLPVWNTRYWVLRRRTDSTIPAPTQLAQNEKSCAKHDRDIRDVEHSGPEGSDTQV